MILCSEEIGGGRLPCLRWLRRSLACFLSCKGDIDSTLAARGTGRRLPKNTLGLADRTMHGFLTAGTDTPEAFPNSVGRDIDAPTTVLWETGSSNFTTTGQASNLGGSLNPTTVMAATDTGWWIGRVCTCRSPVPGQIKDM